MQRDFRFDIARTVCMCYIIAALHLSQYLGLQYYIYETYIGRLITFSCLGLFTFMSGYLIGGKYDFTPSTDRIAKGVLLFYKKRFVRIYPLFFIATILLYVIGFNKLKASIYGLLGIAPFVVQQPKTLWYVSMLMIFYLITPLVNRKSIWWRVLMSTGFILLFGLLKLFIYVDARFIFNLFFYCLGLVMSGIKIGYFNKTDYSNIWLHIVIIVAFVAALLLTNRWFSNTISFFSVSAFGVMALFSLSNLLSNIHNKALFKIVEFVSYASMVCYMFHRFFYWAGLELCSPAETIWKILYLEIVFIIGLVVSYFIQRGYDRLFVKKTK